MTVALAKEVTLLDFRHKPDTNSTPLQPIQTDHSITFRQIRSKERRLNLICNAMNYKIKKSDMAHSHSLKPTNTNHTLFFFDSINLKNLFYTFLVVYWRIWACLIQSVEQIFLCPWLDKFQLFNRRYIFCCSCRHSQLLLYNTSRGVCG